jgi:hypothetical protein
MISSTFERTSRPMTPIGIIDRVATGRTKQRSSSHPAARLKAHRVFTDSPLEGTGFEPSVPRDTTEVRDGLMPPLPDSRLTEKSARTRTDTMTTPGAFRCTDGSNPVPAVSPVRTDATARLFRERAGRFMLLEGLACGPRHPFYNKFS